ncbi:MAG: right-handed parallel beta-helix repeat-containing protein [Phycisphaerales bacterium]|nr:right-handed parallel beta-helix repeat-containing protein [Phycisphaerales bacterium]
MHTPSRPHVWPAVIAVLVLGGGAALVALAGPLDPPAGPVAPTFKTLSEVEPRIAINSTNTPGDADSVFHIAAGGSYYLTGNLIGLFDAGKHGIEIAASNVTIDLGGFRITGGASTLDGIYVSDLGLKNITICNGAVTNWGGEGVNAHNATGGSITGVHASDNGALGIHAGIGFVVLECTATDNETGIVANRGSVVEHCAASMNLGAGIAVGFNCSVIGCTASSNAAGGIFSQNYSRIADCAAADNGGWGIEVLAGCSVLDSLASANGSGGIRADSGCLIRANSCERNGTGANSGPGILITVTDCRVEGNNCTNADWGLKVEGAGNIIIRNTCSGNTTNWSIVAGNAVAPIVSASKNATAISGNSYVGSLGSTDPNANFTY